MSFFFVQMADTQFGMFAGFSGLTGEALDNMHRRGLHPPAVAATGLEIETDLYTRAIAATNRLGAAFAVVCGDLVNNHDNLDQHAELARITAQLRDDIPMYWVAGNHDVLEPPTEQTLAAYRNRYGPDNYSFDHEGSHFVVINSTVVRNSSEVPHEWDAVLHFLESDLSQARDGGADNIVLFTHHPLFLSYLDEVDNWLNVPHERRTVVVDLLKRYGVTNAFAGHWHQNNDAYYGDLEITASGAIGCPLGRDPSGLRVVKVYDDRIEHEYFGLDELPDRVEL
jgi:3',5'-cyclic AMP phosphodiesterase CpdA